MWKYHQGGTEIQRLRDEQEMERMNEGGARDVKVESKKKN